MHRTKAQTRFAAAQTRFAAAPILFAAAVFAAPPILLCAQELMTGPGPGRQPLLLNGDLAVLDAGDKRKDLNCSVAPQKPVLGLDLKFHSGYSVVVPLKDLQDAGTRLSMIFRVIPQAAGSSPAFFNQRFRVPRLTQTSGQALLEGSYDLGEGDYHVDWLMRDSVGRYCSFSWDVTAAPNAKDQQIALAIPAHSVRQIIDEPFQAEPPVARAIGETPLNIKILMNFAPQSPTSAALSPQDRLALVSILRDLSRNPHIGKMSLVTFNLQQQRVIYRQEFASQIDFPALGSALKSLNLGTIDFHALQDKNSTTEFLSTLTRKEMAADPHVDGLIFVGPRSFIDSSIPEDELKKMAEPDYPIYYLNYTADPIATPWRDAIGRMVKFFKGREFTISGPRDLWNAVSETVDRITQFKQTRGTAVLSGGIGHN